MFKYLVAFALVASLFVDITLTVSLAAIYAGWRLIMALE